MFTLPNYESNNREVALLDSFRTKDTFSCSTGSFINRYEDNTPINQLITMRRYEIDSQKEVLLNTIGIEAAIKLINGSPFHSRNMNVNVYKGSFTGGTHIDIQTF